MRIAILAYGSRGDVQPMVALGLGLKNAGASVVVAVDLAFESLVRGAGLEFSGVESHIRDAFANEVVDQWLIHGANPIRQGRIIRRQLEPIIGSVVHDTVHSTEDADGILVCGAAYFAGASIAEARSIPFVQSDLGPSRRTVEFPSTFLPLPRRKDRSLYNSLGYEVGRQAFWQVLRPIINGERKRVFGLKPWPLFGNFRALDRDRVLQLCGWSRHLLPRPHDWPHHVHVTGNWWLPETGWEPPSDLVDFLESGSPPVCVGFGSMRHPHPERFTHEVVQAIEGTGQRAILLTGWGALVAEDLPDSMYALEYAPHEWLFPRCRAVVHHGGAGTIAAGLRAGMPAVVVPFFGDQPFWSWRLERLGIAAPQIHARELTADCLAHRLNLILADERYAANARDYAPLIRREDGVDAAVQLMLDYFEKRRRS